MKTIYSPFFVIPLSSDIAGRAMKRKTPSGNVLDGVFTFAECKTKYCCC